MAAQGTTKQMENVWDYPRPPAIQPVTERLQVVFNGVTIADTMKGYRILETSHPPTYYIPPADIKKEYFVANSKQTYCEWKGDCHYYDIQVGDKSTSAAAWYYPSPNATYAALANCVAIYASRMEACYVGDEKVTAQAGDFYGGWVTSKISGGDRGMKGGPGTWGW